MTAFNMAWKLLKGSQNTNQRKQWWRKQEQIQAQRTKDNQAQRLIRLEEQKRKDEEQAEAEAARYEAEALAAVEAAMTDYQQPEIEQ
tara:strand:+ start:645 stop:905 length:261 start_codon:yes stop_codon:yes gene_type:complete